MRINPLLLLTIGLLNVVGINTGLAQEFEYLEVTGEEKTRLKINITTLPQGKELVFTDPETFSHHIFAPEGHTKKWSHRDDESEHDFEAVRDGNQIHIKGIFKGEVVEKTVEVDEKPWINKLDHGLSAWVTADDEDLVFWTLKLSSDLDPIEFRAEKVGTETLSISGNEYQTIKVKLTLDGLLLSKLWSAYCWYSVNNGLFLKFEGTNGGPGTPLTTIELTEIIAP